MFILKSARYLFLPAFFLFAVSAAAFAAGGKEPPIPADLPPLAENWRQLAYDGITKNFSDREREKHKYLFLAPPVPCVVTQHSKIVFSP